MHPQFDQLTSPDSDKIQGVELTVLRSKRSDCAAAETDISFVRRLAQGRLDIVGHEVRHRRGGDATTDVNEVLFDMPSILRDAPTPAKPSNRAPRIDEPSAAALELLEELDAIVSPQQLSDLGALGQEALTELIGSLQSFESELSAMRRTLHEKIDGIQQEIVRRYQKGEASVDTLLE